MRNDRRPLNRPRLRGSRGDTSTRIAIGLALAVVVLTAAYIAYLIAHGGVP